MEKPVVSKNAYNSQKIYFKYNIPKIQAAAAVTVSHFNY
jgi:hypothetical protein